GGTANTYEDPPELPLHGAWGDGICYQKPVELFAPPENPGAGYERALLKSFREFPATSGGGNILFCGEIRDNETASNVLKQAQNSHLVIATIHAKSAQAAVRRMVTLAAGAKDNADTQSVREMLAETLTAVFYQKLIWRREGEG